MRDLKKHKGISLLEVLLVLAVAASILILSIKTYQGLRVDTDVQRVQYNVDQLFQAASMYYKANCRGLYDPTTGLLTPGVLNPNTTPTPAASVAVSVSQLQTDGYLPSDFGWQPLNPLIDNTNSLGYIVQYNRHITTPVNVNDCVVMTPGTPCVSTQTPLLTTQAQTYLWDIQIAVKIKDSTKVTAYKNLLGATCRSTYSSPTVSPCPGDSTGSYVVFTRLPSFSSPSIQSGLWMSMPQLKQFNLQYTHDQMYELIPGTTDTQDPNNNSNTMRNYNCGG